MGLLILYAILNFVFKGAWWVRVFLTGFFCVFRDPVLGTCEVGFRVFPHHVFSFTDFYFILVS